jgi:hypothetical protein
MDRLEFLKKNIETIEVLKDDIRNDLLISYQDKRTKIKELNIEMKDNLKEIKELKKKLGIKESKKIKKLSEIRINLIKFMNQENNYISRRDFIKKYGVDMHYINKIFGSFNNLKIICNKEIKESKNISGKIDLNKRHTRKDYILESAKNCNDNITYTEFLETYNINPNHILRYFENYHNLMTLAGKNAKKRRKRTSFTKEEILNFMINEPLDNITQDEFCKKYNLSYGTIARHFGKYSDLVSLAGKTPRVHDTNLSDKKIRELLRKENNKSITSEEFLKKYNIPMSKILKYFKSWTNLKNLVFMDYEKACYIVANNEINNELYEIALERLSSETLEDKIIEAKNEINELENMYYDSINQQINLRKK